jgi:hypothetical protein
MVAFYGGMGMAGNDAVGKTTTWTLAESPFTMGVCLGGVCLVSRKHRVPETGDPRWIVTKSCVVWLCTARTWRSSA